MVTKQFFGKFDGKDVSEFIIENGDIKAHISDFGATITRLYYKGVDCVLGYDDLDGFVNGKSCQGATVGRYANRIEHASFTLNGERYTLDMNRGNNCLHGGSTGFAHRMFNAEIIDVNSVAFSIYSPDLEGGFPGNLKLTVLFAIEDNTLSINYTAESDKDTVVNFTNHAYFTLGAENCLNTSLMIKAEEYCALNENNVPERFIRVEGTAFDFRSPKLIGRDIKSDEPQIEKCKGYDHNFVLGHSVEFRDDVAVAECSETGIKLSCSTDLPGVQLYCATGLNEPVGKDGKPLTQYGAFCLETQFFPNSPNEPMFPSSVLKAGETFMSTTKYKFSDIN